MRREGLHAGIETRLPEAVTGTTQHRAHGASALAHRSITDAQRGPPLIDDLGQY